MAPLVIGVYGMIWGSGAYLIPPYSVSSRPANTFTLQPLNLTFLLMIMLHVECPFCALQKQLRRNLHRFGHIENIDYLQKVFGPMEAP